MSEKLCLKWNDFQENVNTAFGNLREDNDFADVTLACEDGQQIEAHKVILAASSPFFKKMLIQNKHVHPLIYMRGVSKEDMKAIVDFLYNGEANIPQESLDSFLAIASELKLKGLMVTDEGETERLNTATSKQQQMNHEPIAPFINSHEIADSQRSNTKEDRTMAKMDNFSGDLFAELDERVKSMMEKSQNMISYGKGRILKANVCKVCGKEGQIVVIRNHIEAIHLEGIALPCNMCEKIFSTRNGLGTHISRHHKQ